MGTTDIVMEAYSNLGPVFGTLAILIIFTGIAVVWLAKTFLKHIDKSDQRLTEQINGQNLKMDNMQNAFTEERKAWDKERIQTLDVLQGLKGAIENLTDRVGDNNTKVEKVWDKVNREA